MNSSLSKKKKREKKKKKEEKLDGFCDSSPIPKKNKTKNLLWDMKQNFERKPSRPDDCQYSYGLHYCLSVCARAYPKEMKWRKVIEMVNY